ncbi:MAG: hypothetical protein ABR607_05530 [Pyrinomonadaceae bacterium]
MTELDEAWEVALAQATQRAHGAGRADIARYLDLRRRNDLLRRAATDWLIDVVFSLAADANRAGASIQVERNEDHRFKRASATMVGTRLTLRRGVRALTVESGWPRAPRDGIVRGNALACANIKHLGQPRKNEELILVSSAKGSPQWFALKDDERSLLTHADLQRHFSVLTQS